MKTLMSQRIFNSNICRILFATCLSALCLAALSAEAATITVMNTNDSGAGSLRAALASAANGDTIDATGISGAILLTSGELTVDKSVTINGPGAANLAVDGNATSRVFQVGSGTTVTIAGLTIANGAGYFGGGIYTDSSTLTINNCVLSGNSATGSFGGGIYTDSSTLTINNCILSGNSAAVTGGAIINSDFTVAGGAILTINNSTLSGNSAVGRGGGIENSGTLEINNSILSGNSGGAIFNGVSINNVPGTVTVNNSTLSGNSGFVGGGIGNAGTLTINNSTLSGNSATLSGGGIWNRDSTLTINNSTLSGNSAIFQGGGIFNGTGGTIELTGTILNAGASGENIANVGGTVTSLDYNLSSDNGGGVLTATGDQINTDPLLGPLQDNGGPTFTHELLNGSPAIDAGDPNFNPNSFNPPMVYDQHGTGFNRVVNGRIDIGAFEVQAVPSSYAGQVQQPINADGSSVFSVRRGVVPVKFTLTQGGVATCALPPATIAVTRTSGGATGAIDESVYSGSADAGSNFRIDSCQYVYNLSASALGIGTYRVDIEINGQVVGSGIFQLK
jgi:hypothetical protein